MGIPIPGKTVFKLRRDPGRLPLYLFCLEYSGVNWFNAVLADPSPSILINFNFCCWWQLSLWMGRSFVSSPDRNMIPNLWNNRVASLTIKCLQSIHLYFCSHRPAKYSRRGYTSEYAFYWRATIHKTTTDFMKRLSKSLPKIPNWMPTDRLIGSI